MTLRVLCLPVLVAVAACGSGQDPVVEGAGEATSSTAAPGGDGELSLAIEVPDDLVAGQPVTWRLTVTNGTDVPVTLAFTSGQQGEVVLVGANGTEAYRWSEGMMFAQSLTETELAAGADMALELPGTLDVDPGTYVLEASAPSEPAPEPVIKDVTVTG